MYQYLKTRLLWRRGMAFGAIIIIALTAFEIFNFSTTEFALSDLLGPMETLGVRWATVLAVAFCGIDFAGLARLFTPEVGADEPTEVWYLFGAWLLAAGMNAMLTWWGVSIAMLGDTAITRGVLDQGLMMRAVPIFVAVLVWLIRVLIISTFALAGDRLFSQLEQREQKQGTARTPRKGTNPYRRKPVTTPAARPSHRPVHPAPKPVSSVPAASSSFYKSEPTYQPLAAREPEGGNAAPRY